MGRILEDTIDATEVNIITINFDETTYVLTKDKLYYYYYIELYWSTYII